MDSESIIIAGKYRLLECIGEGAFGEIFYGKYNTIIAIDITNNTKVAIKLESTGLKHSSLKIEELIYKMLGGESGFPKLYWMGSDGEYNILAIELLGLSLESLLQTCDGKFSKQTSFNLADQMVNNI